MLATLVTLVVLGCLCAIATLVVAVLHWRAFRAHAETRLQQHGELHAVVRAARPIYGPLR